jgi:hypothetical protein
VRALASLALGVGLALAGCSSEPDDEQRVQAKATEVPKDFAAQAKVNIAAIENEYGTPIKDRVVTVGLLNKRNDLTQDLTMKPGESRRYGNVIVKLATCERTLPWERPADIGAFVQVFVEERASTSEPLAWRKVFSGWLFKNSPSLNAVEHPVYDVWVKDCAMKFPGEEEDPAAAASPTSAAKASGSGSARPSPTPSPAPKTAPSPVPIAAR